MQVIDLSGDWDEWLVGEDGAHIHDRLHITQQGQKVTGVSTSSGETWSGELDGSTLKVTYVGLRRDGGTLNLEVVKGMLLKGLWATRCGENPQYDAEGAYRAYRLVTEEPISDERSQF